MNMPHGTRSERAFVEAILVELAGGKTQFSRDDVKTLIGCYRRECKRFDELANSVAYDIEQDETHLLTMFGEFTVGLIGGKAEADTLAMRDQIDRDNDYTGKESSDAENS